MASISRILRLNTLRQSLSHFSRNLTSHSVQHPVQSVAPLISKLNFTHNHWIWQQNDKLKLPLISKIEIDLPNGLKWVPPVEEPQQNDNIEMPAIDNGETSKQAARLIIIRRKKMKKHKLRKLRKRMKFEWGKRRQRREWKKEKEFQAALVKQCKEAEVFSAEKYVEEKLALFNQVLESKSARHKRVTDKQ